jgi:hypothetical protein
LKRVGNWWAKFMLAYRRGGWSHAASCLPQATRPPIAAKALRRIGMP